jgi:hypothetical protein
MRLKGYQPQPPSGRTGVLRAKGRFWIVFINPNCNPNRCYEILKPPYQFFKIRFGLGWDIGREKRSGVREARAGEAQVNK